MKTCNPHLDAPHGFDRNASHSADEYICECEGWEPEDIDCESEIENPEEYWDALTEVLKKLPTLPDQDNSNDPEPLL